MGLDLNGKELGPGIVQRKDGKYQARYTDKQSKRKSIYSKSLKEIKKSLGDAIYEEEHGINGDRSSLTVDKWYAIWLEKYKRPHVRSTTISSYVSGYKIISSQIGTMNISTVKPIHILEIIDFMHSKSYKTGTIKGLKAILFNIFQKAYENDLIRKNPVVGITINGEDDKKIRVLTIDEQEIFLNEITDSWYCEFFNILLLSGLRCGEIMALTWDCVDLEKRELYIRKTRVEVQDGNGKYIYELHPPKTRNSARMVPLSKEALYFFDNQRKKTLKFKKINHGEFGNLIFVGRNGSMVSSTNIRKILRTKVNTINKKYNMTMEFFSPHVLRHTFATRCFESGIDIKTVSVVLGHSKTNITMDLYTHVTEENLVKEMAKLKVIGPAREVI
ncbi:site-specific integrase [[Clostridium] fimetarium]|uniref:Site-specific recombinase XerD n=1 Tax=[Clostridium] fimetarium TaxID=99656 RepID=A0A1I0QVT3_9FIRM|nr:site-specific integrase [[Clostridium] fimetarium]SEW31580.1 Site-specific recombinase XerD [[Clostridium] fimetarium]